MRFPHALRLIHTLIKKDNRSQGDSISFPNALLHKDISLIFINYKDYLFNLYIIELVQDFDIKYKLHGCNYM